MEMPTIPQLIYVMKSSNQQSISENSEVESWTFMINFHQAASAWLSVTSLNHETVTPGRPTGPVSVGIAVGFSRDYFFPGL